MQYELENGYKVWVNAKTYRSKLNKQVCIKCLKQYWPDADSVWDVQAELKWEEGRLYICPCSSVNGRDENRRAGRYNEGRLIEHDPPEACPFKTEHLVSCNKQGFIYYKSRIEEYCEKNFKKVKR